MPQKQKQAKQSKAASLALSVSNKRFRLTKFCNVLYSSKIQLKFKFNQTSKESRGSTTCYPQIQLAPSKTTAVLQTGFS
jgi:hypothetical protein